MWFWAFEKGGVVVDGPTDSVRYPPHHPSKLKPKSTPQQVRTLAQRTLEWCQPGGHAFFRESCFRQSGDVSRAFNPSHYRHPSFYTRVFSEVCAYMLGLLVRASRRSTPCLDVGNFRWALISKQNTPPPIT